MKNLFDSKSGLSLFEKIQFQYYILYFSITEKQHPKMIKLINKKYGNIITKF